MAVLVVLVFCFLVLGYACGHWTFPAVFGGGAVGFWAYGPGWLHWHGCFWLCGVVWLVGCYLYSGASICDASFFVLF